MDRISNLPEDLLLKILSSLPIKDVVSTTILSKSWKFLWTMVPKLDFDDNGVEYRVFQEYVDKVLVSNTAPVLETLKLKLGCHLLRTDDITTWITTSIANRLRELEIHRSVNSDDDDAYSFKLPQCLYTSEKLVVLKLYESILLDVPVDVSLPSLKSLYLVSVMYKNFEESHRRLLTACPVLEELVIDKSENYSVPALSLSVVIPSLQRLSILDALPFRSSVKRDKWYENKVVINVPSLKFLSYVDIYDYGHTCTSENIPDLVEANVKLICNRPAELMRSITSVKSLSLCLHGPMLTHRIEFHQLVHLELCGCNYKWWELYTWMLENSPKLQVLKINHCKEWVSHYATPISGRWRQPSSVPECLTCHLSTFEWKYYSGGREAKRLVGYILKNGRQLKTVDIKLCQRKTKAGQIKELASLPRASSSCQLLLDDTIIY